MVDRKGIGYAIELVIAFLILFLFVVGGMQLYGDKSYTDYRISASAHDLTYVASETGHMDEFARKGYTGSMETFMDRISDRGLVLSGTITGLPLQDEINIGFHTVENKKHDQEFDDVSSLDDQCYDDGSLGEIESVHDGEAEEILRTEGGKADDYDVHLYLAETDSSDEYEYDSLFVDNETRCSFPPEAGPYNIDDIFKWTDSEQSSIERYFEFKQGVANSGEEALFYNATQVQRFREGFNQPLNGLDISTDITTFNFEEDDFSSEYDLAVFRGEQSYGDATSNDAALNDARHNTSFLFLTNMTGGLDGYLDTDTPFEDEGESAEIEDLEFSSNWASQSIRGYLEALGGERYVKYPIGQVFDSGYVSEDRALAFVRGEDVGGEPMEAVNYRTSLPGSDDEMRRLARTGYLEYPNYDEQQIRFVVAISYWLTQEEESFNEEADQTDLISTSAIGTAEEDAPLPYRVDLRWR